MLPQTLALLWTLYCKCCGGLCFPVWNVRKGTEVQCAVGCPLILCWLCTAVTKSWSISEFSLWDRIYRSCYSLMAFTCYMLFTVMDRLQVSWGRVRKQTHTPVRKASLSSCHMILIIPYRLKILAFLANTMLHCFPLHAWRPVMPNLRPVTTATSLPSCRSGYLCIDTLVSMGTIASGFSFRSSQSRLFPSSSSSAPSSGFPLLSMCDAGKSTKNAADYWRRLALTRSSSGVTQV